ncbi:MAG: hypothetical protein LQ346_006923 [Caloplaca aetnensis]|nr:MAG: hypothetical protein LQ346_006923 [Caloplaca aetnensis]
MAVPHTPKSADPWDWTVDEVTAALCHPASPFRSRTNPQVLPNATFLEGKLREHCIDGCSLLTDINNTSLKEDLGISALGQRGHIQREVQRLRWDSPRYLDYLNNGRPEPSPRYFTVHDNAEQPNVHIGHTTQEWLNQLPDLKGSIAPGDVPDVPDDLFEQPQLTHDETTIVDENGRKRRKLVLNAAIVGHPEEKSIPAPVDTTTFELFNEQTPASVADASVSLDKDSRKRIAPSLIYQPNRTHEDFQAPAAESLPNAEHSRMDSTPQTLASRKPDDAYLGTKAFHVEDLFYERVDSSSKLANHLVGRTVLKDEKQPFNFAVTSIPASNGQRLYVNSRIQHFLRQRPQQFCRGPKKRYGIIPYPDMLGLKHQSLSMTIFDTTPHDVIALRKDRAGWLPANSIQSLGRGRGLADTDDDVHRLPAPLENDNGADWDFLEKWHHAPEHDHVLPGYGESGSEGEYDLELWRLIEQENGGKLPRPLGNSRQMRKVREDDVLDAIEKAIQRIIEDWSVKRLPKLQRTAWILWSKSRRNGSKHVQVSSLTHDVEHLNIRLDKLRKEIAKEKWLSVKQVSRQCESMRRTVWELQDSRWKISTLELRIRPQKPQNMPKVKPEKPDGPIPSGDEQGIEVDSSAGETSAGDDLDGFIVDDEDATSVEDDVHTADMANGSQIHDDGDLMNGTQNTHEGGQQAESEKVHLEELALKGPKKEIAAQPASRLPVSNNIIDLTLDSDSEPEPPPTMSNALTTHSASKQTVDSALSEDEDPVQRSQRKKAMFKTPQRLPETVDQSNLVDPEGDSAYDSASEPVSKLPELYETSLISIMDPELLMERSDRKRLLIWLLTRCNLERRENAYAYISNQGLISVQEDVWRTIGILRGRRRSSRGAQSDEEPEVIRILAGWFIQWTNAVIITASEGAKGKQLAVAEADTEGFAPFYFYLHELQCLCDYESPSGSIQPLAHGNPSIRDTDGSAPMDASASSPIATPTKSTKTSSKEKRGLIEYLDGDLQPVSVKKRKYIVPESQEAADARKKAHERVQDRENRQRKLKKRLERMGQTEEDPSQVAVNLGKLEDQELVYLPASIGARIQPHQKDGVRFLWREIIEDHATGQGCLLAQTMGLGKTMQVISFLVAVAQAAQSPDANMRNQIPPRLRESKTLVLCPPALIDNWYEEFLIWAPDDMAETIGDIRKVQASMGLQERLQTVEDWGDEGGILVLGFAVLRDFIENPVKPKTRQSALDDDQHQRIVEILLKGPAIVVADEAHAAKNRNSKLHKILLRFRTGSRIALTGSPLSNNLSEYYSLIEWVAPGYLGEHREFVAHYEEPIQLGLYRDSKPWEWRAGLKKLELFKREVQPKVHRADVSVLAQRLRGKSEFVIKLVLTPLQEQLYQAFVESMSEQYAGTEGPRTATLWAWISMLRLVCNHPKCFYDKLHSIEAGKAPAKRSKKNKSSVAEELGIADEDMALLEASPRELGMSEDLVRRQLQPFQTLDVPVDAISLANKMVILLQILELSVAAGDKVLVFSHSLQTLDYVAKMLTAKLTDFLRLDGTVETGRRQKMTKKFNEGSVNIFLVSTRAGGTGLNLFGANRVVILDDHFNPTWEEQAIGRAYRIGQTKHVYVYRLTVGGTFEEALHNQSLFKQQLATRAVDKRNIERQATRSAKDYFQPVKAVEQTDLQPMKGKDLAVLDQILTSQAEYVRRSYRDQHSLTWDSKPYIRAIVPCETFQQEVDEKLTAEEQKEVEQQEEMSRLRRTDPPAWQAKMAARAAPYVSRPPFQPGSSNSMPASSMPLPLHVGPNAPKPLTEAEGPPSQPSSVGKHATQGVMVANTTSPSPASLLQLDRNYGAPRFYASMPPPQQSSGRDMEERAGSEPIGTPKQPASGTFPSNIYPSLQDMMDRTNNR